MCTIPLYHKTNLRHIMAMPIRFQYLGPTSTPPLRRMAVADTPSRAKKLNGWALARFLHAYLRKPTYPLSVSYNAPPHVSSHETKENPSELALGGVEGERWMDSFPTPTC